MAELCDLQIHINGQQTFFLNERIISKFSGKIRKIIKKEKRRTQIKNSEIQIDDFPGGTDGFEFISRFCYNNATTTINISNISLLHCCALFLGMTEKLSPCNLLQQTETFLEGMAYWSWNDILICLKSCESFFSYADSYGLIQKLLTSLLAKISQNSEIFLSSSSSSSSPETTSSFRQSSSTKGTTPEVLGIKNYSSRKSWWFEDLTILPPMIIERFVMTLGAYGTDNNSLVLTRFLLNYLKSIAQSKHGLINKTCSKYQYAGLADTSVYGVLFIGKSSFSCRVLFWVLRLVSGFGISRDCRTGLERLIGSVLDQATLDDLLVSGNDGHSVYDVNLVVRLIRLFVHSYNKEEYLQKMKKVGWLIDMYLGEVAPDQNLKISKFLGVAESLADCARDCFDGVYRAVDLYLESHPCLSLEERSRLCRCLNYEKLSLESCKELAKNPRIPPRVAVEALAAQSRRYNSNNNDGINNIAITAAAATKDDHHEYYYSFANNYESSSSSSISPSKSHKYYQMVLYNGGAGGAANTDIKKTDQERINIISEENMIKDDEEMRLNLQRMQWRVLELEKVCRKMKGQMSRMGKTSAGRTPLISPARSKALPRLC